MLTCSGFEKPGTGHIRLGFCKTGLTVKTKIRRFLICLEILKPNSEYHKMKVTIILISTSKMELLIMIKPQKNFFLAYLGIAVYNLNQNDLTFGSRHRQKLDENLLPPQKDISYTHFTYISETVFPYSPILPRTCEFLRRRKNYLTCMY